MEKSRYCRNCGHVLEIDAKFCTECGTAVKKPLTEAGDLDWTQAQEKYTAPVEPKVKTTAPERAGISASAEKAKLTEQQIKKKKTIMIGSVIAGVLILIGIVAVALSFSGTSGNQSLKDGQQYLNAGEYEKAVTAFEEAVKENPDSLEARLGLADAYVGLEEYSVAISYLDEALDVDGSSVDAYGKKADIYSTLDQTYELNDLVRKAAAKNVDLSKKYGYQIPDVPDIIVSDDAYSSVSINGKTTGQTIKYTIDGAEPTDRSNTYDKPLENLKGNVTVKAIVINDKKIHSDVATKALSLQVKEYSYNKDITDYLGKTYKELVTGFGELNSLGAAEGGTLFSTPKSSYIFAFESEEPADTDRCTAVTTEAKYFFNGMGSGGMALTDAEKTLGFTLEKGEEAATCEIGTATIFIFNYTPQISINSEIRCKLTKDVRGE